MREWKGKAVHKGTAVGKVIVLNRSEPVVRRERIADAQAQIERYEQAAREAAAQLKALYEKAVSETGRANAAIFEIHQMMLEDQGYVNTIRSMIETELVNAEYAVASAGKKFAQMFAAMDDDYMKVRAEDIMDISDRIVRILDGAGDMPLTFDEPVIVIADDLMPSEIIQLDREKILALVMVHGSASSHASILARTMSIPALIGVSVNLQEIQDGVTAIVDGAGESLVLEPTEAQCRQAERQLALEGRQTLLLQSLKGKESVTTDGRKISLYANIGSVADIESVLENDAEGIGLFRSECLYLGRQDFPTEEEQFQVYRQVLQSMEDRRVVIRTMDIGVDKKADYFHLDREENPALGYRAIRICLTQPEIFKTQLRALMRAAVYGRLSVMYPMIISVEEVHKIHGIVEETMRELERDKIPCVLPEQGIMVETPAAAIISDELAEAVDFFSIGTNDLTQYTLALDRQNEKLDAFYNPYHKAVLRMIKMVTDNAHRHGKRVGICGELGNDPALTEEFVNMGVDELSVPPSMILKLRQKIREI